MIVTNVVSLGKIEEGSRNLGEKATSLSKMLGQGIPGSRGFVVTDEACELFMKNNRLEEGLNDVLSEVDEGDVEQLIRASKGIREMFGDARFPDSLEKEISDAYNEMFVSVEAKEIGGAALDFIKAGRDLISVSVRPSPPKLDNSCSTGIYEAQLNVSGMRNLFERIRKAWYSAYTPKAIYYRRKRSLPDIFPLSVIIQKMVNPEKSGTATLVNGHVVIEGNFGLGISISEGIVSPDRYVLEKDSGRLEEKSIGKKACYFTKDEATGDTRKEMSFREKAGSQLLNGEEIGSVFSLFRKVYDIFSRPVSIDWSFERGRVFLLQVRSFSWEQELSPVRNECIPVSPGTGKGTVRRIESVNDFSGLGEGKIAVSKNLSTDLVLLLGRISGLITENGCLGSNLSCLAREFGVPCISGMEMASLENGKTVTVDGSGGSVSVESPEVQKAPGGDWIKDYEIVDSGNLTGTEVKVNLDFSKEFDTGKDFDGIVVRPERLFGDRDPLVLARTNPDEFSGILGRVGNLVREVYPKMVWYVLMTPSPGGEQGEENPLLGMRGVRSILENRDMLTKELELIRELHSEGMNNIGIIVPFVSSSAQLRSVRNHVPPSVRTGIEVSTPNVCFEADSFLREEVDIFLVNLRELSQFALGVDPGNPRVSDLFSENSVPVIRMIENLIMDCRQRHIETSVLLRGYDQQLVERLILAGVGSVTLDPEFLETGKNDISRVERRMLLERVRNPGPSFSSPERGHGWER